MLKQPDATGINPVTRITPVLVVESIGSTAQELDDRAAQFVKGQVYFAHVLSNAGGTTFTVRVDGVDVKNTDLKNTDLKNTDLKNTSTNEADVKGNAPKDLLLKMDLGSSAKAGQTLSLRYMHGDPVLTFALTPITSNVAGSSVDISAAAILLGHYLKQAESDAVPVRLQATAIVSHAPESPQMMAHDLKHAVSNSGLFYESHLSDLVQNNRTLAAIKQEPQNQSGTPIVALMSQQLAVLENQQIAWHGEVWPGQKMDWDIDLQPRDVTDDNGQSSPDTSQNNGDRPVSSEMTLHFPHLGKVSAKLTLIDGRMTINVSAEQATTLEAFKNQRQSLAKAVIKNGQQLDALTVVQNE